MLDALKTITYPENSDPDNINESHEDSAPTKASPQISEQSQSEIISNANPLVDLTGPRSIKTSVGPLQLIHVIFGLCLEILAKTSSTGSSGATVNNQSSANMLSVVTIDNALQGCLTTLRSILDSAFIQAEYLRGVFLEMMTILERVAWMEGSRVQGLVVGVISTVIQGYGKELLFEHEPEAFAQSENALSPTIDAIKHASTGIDIGQSLTSALPGRCLQSLVQLLVELYMQKSTRSNPKSSKSSGGRVRQKTTMETVELMGRVTEMLTTLVRVAPAGYQLHLAAVTLNVLVGKSFLAE